MTALGIVEISHIVISHTRFSFSFLLFNFQGPSSPSFVDSFSTISQSYPFVKYFFKSFLTFFKVFSGFFSKVTFNPLSRPLYDQPRSPPDAGLPLRPPPERLPNISLFQGFVNIFFLLLYALLHGFGCIIYILIYSALSDKDVAYL